jgi:cytochrome c551/c552
MRLNSKNMTVLVGPLLIAAAFAGSATAATEPDPVQRCEAMAARFKMADVSQLSPERLEAARRQAIHGERLCKSEPQTGVKAIGLALKDIGDTTI